MKTARLIMYHKQSTSARTRFLALSYRGVCAFDGSPKLSNIIEQDDEPTGPVGHVVPHPAMVIAEAELKLSMPAGALESDADFRVVVDAPGGPIEIYLAHFTDIDPPFEAAVAKGARFLDITQTRGMPAAELQVLRRAYEYILG